MPTPRRFRHSDTGTPAADWDPLVARLPDLSLPATGPVAVIAPHPDDETLGAGGLMASFRRAGRQVRIVAVTDGERATGEPSDQLAAIRRAELDRATEELGVVDIRRLHVADGGVTDAIATVQGALRPLLRGVSLCIGPYWADGHPDHEATGNAAILACRDLGVPFLAYPVWAWHWGDPGATDLLRTAALVRLDDDAVGRKRRAVARYRSQVTGPEPILHAGMLAHFQRPLEVFLRVP
jgi:LmbE family N-acetylglucosaminyl deacetylase